MNIDNGEGCLNALWYETGAVVEDCDGIWRVNVLLGGRYGFDVKVSYENE